MLALFRRPPARSGRGRGRVVLRLEGFEFRAAPSGGGGTDDTPISTTGNYNPPANQAPHIEVYCEEVGIGVFLITGQVTDESPGGLTVRFGGIPSAQGKSTVTNSDGSFSMLLYVQTNGTDIGVVTAQTTDAQGLDSNEDYDSIHPTPPPGG